MSVGRLLRAQLFCGLQGAAHEVHDVTPRFKVVRQFNDILHDIEGGALTACAALLRAQGAAHELSDVAPQHKAAHEASDIQHNGVDSFS